MNERNNTPEEIATAVIAEILRHEKTLPSADDLRQKCEEYSDQSVEDACIYYHNAYDYACSLESDWGLEADEYDGGAVYPAGNWQEAMQSRAVALLRCAVYAALGDGLADMAEQTECFSDEVVALGGDPEKATLSSECEYGWAAHNFERNNCLIWNDDPSGCFPELLEGELIAVSCQVASGIWANTCWTPEPGE